jgi:hypothetical protein
MKLEGLFRFFLGNNPSNLFSSKFLITFYLGVFLLEDLNFDIYIHRGILVESKSGLRKSQYDFLGNRGYLVPQLD